MYYLIYGIFYLVSLLPFSLLYALSETTYVLLYYIFGYRKNVVRENLRNSFPDKTSYEIQWIEREYYRFLCRQIFETIKLLSISKEELKKRCVYSPRFHQIFEAYYSEKKDVMVLMGHLGNWEWAGACFNLYFQSPLFVLYHPLSNKIFDKLMKKIRTRFGTHLLPMNTAYKHILQNINQSAVFTFIADQCPSPQNAFWMRFLNQDTPVYYAPELIASKLNLPVIFVYLKQIKKGYYLVDAEILEKNTDGNDYPVMHQFMKMLENKIKEQPQIWLWSHRRWKYKK